MINSSSPWIKADISKWKNTLSADMLISVKKGSCFFYQGDVLPCLYIIKSGRALLTSYSNTGAEKIIMFAGIGAIIGEESLFEAIPCEYAATALVDCKAYKIPFSEFKSCLFADFELFEFFSSILLRKQKMLITQITDLSFGDACQRIASELIYSAQIYGVAAKDGIIIDIPITQQDLGDKVQATRITVNKIINTLKNNKIIQKKNGRYVILNINFLYKIKEDKKIYYNLKEDLK